MRAHPRRPRGGESGREKRRDEIFKHRRKSPWVPLLPDHFQTAKRMLAPDWAQKMQKMSSFREFLHDRYYFATVARFVHQAFLTRNEGATDESKSRFRILSAAAIQFALRKFCF